MNNLFEKRMVWVVTVWLKEEDDDGKQINWSNPSEEYYADTFEEAEKMKERFLAGQDEYYGDLVEDVWISDDKEERELLKMDKADTQESKIEDQKTSMLNLLHDCIQLVEKNNTGENREKVPLNINKIR